MSKISDYWDLKKSFVFYGSYHAEWRNQLIHMIFVPTIFTTSLTGASYLRIGGVSVADIVAILYATTFIKMEFVAGMAYAPVLAGMWYVGTQVLTQNHSLAFGLWILGWLTQFFGHGVFEGRKPALMDNLLQSIHAAVFFVWLELLFKLGYKPKLHRELQSLIKSEMKKFK